MGDRFEGTLSFPEQAPFWFTRPVKELPSLGVIPFLIARAIDRKNQLFQPFHDREMVETLT